MNPKPDLPVLTFGNAAEWEEWLARNHASSNGVWLRIARVGCGIISISHHEALEIALCYGWIDGQTGRGDEQYWQQRFAHRRPRSKWSQVNCARAESLLAQGRMKAPGLAEMDSAKRDGRWANAYASPRNMKVPPDLQKRLDEHPSAKAFFNELSSQNRYAILYRLHDARKPETRARRLEKFVGMLQSRKTFH